MRVVKSQNREMRFPFSHGWSELVTIDTLLFGTYAHRYYLATYDTHHVFRK